MATISQIRGMLLEEVVLQLLKTAGYTTVEKAGSDPTLRDGHSGLEVLGRGGKHQIDAVADFFISAPFSYPQRLFVEAKCFSPQYPVGLPILRNAVGVLKDVSEWWNPPAGQNGIATTGRYHYQYAFFSASGFSRDAERYAFAQDIYLIPYERSRFIAAIIQSIRNLTHEDFGANVWNAVDIDIGLLRQFIRDRLNGRAAVFPNLRIEAAAQLGDIVNAVSAIRGTLLAVIARRFPIHLIPAPDLDILELNEHYSVRIFWDELSWYLRDANNGRDLFSFDLPPELFSLYVDDSRLTESRALDLKSDMFDRFQALLNIERTTRIITFELDREWITRVRQKIQQQPRRNEPGFQSENDQR